MKREWKLNWNKIEDWLEEHFKYLGSLQWSGYETYIFGFKVSYTSWVVNVWNIWICRFVKYDGQIFIQ